MLHSMTVLAQLSMLSFCCIAFVGGYAGEPSAVCGWMICAYIRPGDHTPFSICLLSLCIRRKPQRYYRVGLPASFFFCRPLSALGGALLPLLVALAGPYSFCYSSSSCSSFLTSLLSSVGNGRSSGASCCSLQSLTQVEHAFTNNIEQYRYQLREVRGQNS